MNLYKVTLRERGTAAALTRFYVVADSVTTAGAKALREFRDTNIKAIVSEVVELLDAEFLR